MGDGTPLCRSTMAVVGPSGEPTVGFSGSGPPQPHGTAGRIFRSRRKASTQLRSVVQCQRRLAFGIEEMCGVNRERMHSEFMGRGASSPFLWPP
jgi:hypothetical protein